MPKDEQAAPFRIRETIHVREGGIPEGLGWKAERIYVVLWAGVHHGNSQALLVGTTHWKYGEVRETDPEGYRVFLKSHAEAGDLARDSWVECAQIMTVARKFLIHRKWRLKGSRFVDPIHMQSIIERIVFIMKDE